MAEYEKRNAGHSSKGCHVKTKASTSEYEFVWTVEKFSWCPSQLKSSPFPAVPDASWVAVLSVSEEDIQLCFECPWKPSDKVRVRSEVQDCNGKVLHKEYSTRKYKSPSTTSNTPQNRNNTSSFGIFPTRVHAVPEISTFTFDAITEVDPNVYSEMKRLPEDTAIFKCLIQDCVHSTEEDQYHFQDRPSLPNRGLEALSNAMKTLYGLSLYADVDVHAGGTVLRAHKSILCARSPVFSKMFENPMDESEKNAIHITDLELPVLKNLLSFLYTGCLGNDSNGDGFEVAHDLYYAADKYDVRDLRTECSNVLLSRMEVGNACRVLSLASRHCDEELRRSAMAYVQFYFDAVLETEAWSDLVADEPKLASEVMGLRGKKRKAENDGKE